MALGFGGGWGTGMVVGWGGAAVLLTGRLGPAMRLRGEDCRRAAPRLALDSLGQQPLPGFAISVPLTAVFYLLETAEKNTRILLWQRQTVSRSLSPRTISDSESLVLVIRRRC